MNGKIGFPGGKPNGTGLSTGNFSKKREYLQRYSSFLVFTGITRKSLYHLLYHTSAMLLGKNTRFRSRKWRPPSCLSVQLEVSVNCEHACARRENISILLSLFCCVELVIIYNAGKTISLSIFSSHLFYCSPFLLNLLV